MRDLWNCIILDFPSQILTQLKMVFHKSAGIGGDIHRGKNQRVCVGESPCSWRMLQGLGLVEKGLSQTLTFSALRAEFCLLKSKSPSRSQPMGGLERPGRPREGAWPEAVTQR